MRKISDLVDMDTGAKLGTYPNMFWKCFLEDFINVLGVIDNSQLKVFTFLCKNIDSKTNMVLATYAKIEKETKVSQPTIAATIKKLKKVDFMRKVQNGIWFVNPGIFVQGGYEKRYKLMLKYYKPDKEQVDKKERVDETT